MSETGFTCTSQVYDNVLLGKWVHKQRKMRSTKELSAEHVCCPQTQLSLCECLLLDDLFIIIHHKLIPGLDRHPSRCLMHQRE